MGFQVSPGVNVKELDLTTIVPAVATTQAAFAGAFRWGQVEVRTDVVSENDLVNTFGKPNNNYYNSFFTCANYLGYSNNLQVVRVTGTDALNATDSGTGVLVKNETHWNTVKDSNSANKFFAKYPGTLGNSLAVHVFDDDGIKGSTGQLVLGNQGAGSTALGAISVGDLGFALSNQTSPAENEDILVANAGDRIVFFGSDLGGQIVTTLEGTTASAKGSGQSGGFVVSSPFRDGVPAGTTFGLIRRYSDAFLTEPSTTEDVRSAGGTNDALNIVVVDEDGQWTGVKGQILETYENVSKATDALKYDGSGNFYKDVINNESLYIWADEDLQNVTTTTKQGTTFTDIASDAGGTYGRHTSASRKYSLSGGLDGVWPSDAIQYTKGWIEFEDAESVDVSILLGGESSAVVQRLLIDLCDQRKDCIACVSPVGSTGANAASLVKDKTSSQALQNVRDFRNVTLNKSSSYAVMDSGFKYQYDRYNDVYRYVPLNGDIGGLIARAEVEQDAWWSPAGFTRGQIKGVVKLAFNPKKAHRDDLYVDQINPVVAFPGEGVVLFGDKTLQSKPSAFDRINVRRLFIVLEKAIATAAKFSLFEFNDEFTRSQFRNMVVPFLRDVQARRGVYDFKVVCDESNNPGSVIDRNEFVADIYIKPARAINFITLNFIATPTGVDFSEVGG